MLLIKILSIADIFFFCTFLFIMWISILNFIDDTTDNITNNQRQLQYKINKPNNPIILNDNSEGDDGYTSRLIGLGCLIMVFVLTTVIILL